MKITLPISIPRCMRTIKFMDMLLRSNAQFHTRCELWKILDNMEMPL
jgi:hypothetical protein